MLAEDGDCVGPAGASLRSMTASTGGIGGGALGGGGTWCRVSRFRLWLLCVSDHEDAVELADVIEEIEMVDGEVGLSA